MMTDVQEECLLASQNGTFVTTHTSGVVINTFIDCIYFIMRLCVRFCTRFGLFSAVRLTPVSVSG